MNFVNDLIKKNGKFKTWEQITQFVFQMGSTSTRNMKWKRTYRKYNKKSKIYLI